MNYIQMMYFVGLLLGGVVGILLQEARILHLRSQMKAKVKEYLLSLDEREMRHYLKEIGLP